jgi:hypothetical protein
MYLVSPGYFHNSKTPQQTDIETKPSPKKNVAKK